LTITCDYFNTLQQLIVGILGGPTILGSVEALGPASPYANLVAFNNFPGQPGAQPITAPHQLDGNLASVYYIDTLRNLGAARAAGFDLSLNYTWDLRTYGQLQFGINAVIFTEYDLKTTPNSAYYNVLGLDFPEIIGGVPDYKINFLLEYRWQGLTFSANANYIPEMLNAIGNDPEHDDQSTYATIDSFFAVDLRLSYTFSVPKPVAPAPVVDAKDAKDGKNVAPVVAATGCDWKAKLLDGLTLAVGCNNVFNMQPPFISGANSNTDLSLYDGFGRFVYFEISKKF
jgi:iron complex outermembrane receptor protein